MAMNDRLNISISETRLSVYTRDNFQCQFKNCHSLRYFNLQLAHRIGQGHGNYIYKFILKEYGKDLTNKEIDKIINDEDNLQTSCAEHNSNFNIGFKRKEAEALIKKIYEKLYGELYRE
jgi:hypothetical protein